MLELGATFATKLRKGALVYLVGDLGAGKTTFVRGVLRGLGYMGSVKSPTYNIVENYELSGRQLYHFDLYRVNDAEELEYMGIRDYLNSDSITFVEWPEKGENLLPKANIIIQFYIKENERELMIEEV